MVALDGLCICIVSRRSCLGDALNGEIAPLACADPHLDLLIAASCSPTTNHLIAASPTSLPMQSDVEFSGCLDWQLSRLRPPVLLRCSLIALLALSAPPSDCFFAPGSRPCRDLCSTLQDCSLISSSPFLSLLSHPRHCWMACLGSFSAPRHTWRQPTKSSRKAWSSTQQALTSFVSQSSCSAFAGRIP